MKSAPAKPTLQHFAVKYENVWRSWSCCRINSVVVGPATPHFTWDQSASVRVTCSPWVLQHLSGGKFRHFKHSAQLLQTAWPIFAASESESQSKEQWRRTPGDIYCQLNCDLKIQKYLKYLQSLIFMQASKRKKEKRHLWEVKSKKEEN